MRVENNFRYIEIFLLLYKLWHIFQKRVHSGLYSARHFHTELKESIRLLWGAPILCHLPRDIIVSIHSVKGLIPFPRKLMEFLAPISPTFFQLRIYRYITFFTFSWSNFPLISLKFFKIFFKFKFKLKFLKFKKKFLSTPRQKLLNASESPY